MVKKKPRGIKVNLSGVEARKLVAEGPHVVEVTEVEKEKGPKADYLKWTLKVTSGKFKGSTLYTNTSLSPEALWSLRGILEAMEVEIPDDAFELDLEDYVGKQFLAYVSHEEYEGRTRAKVNDYGLIEDAEEDEEDEEPKGKSSKKKPKDEEPEEEEEEAPKKSSKKKPKDEEPEEEDEKPKGKSSKKSDKKKDPELTQEDIQEMSQDELQAVIEEHDLEVDLDEFKTLRKMRNAVVDAAEEKGDILTE